MAYSVSYIKENLQDFSKRLKIKLAGRPTPSLNLVQKIMIKNKEINRYFNLDMYTKTTWICGCADLNSFFCFPCLLFQGESNWTKCGIKDLAHLPSKIQKHSCSEKHILNQMQLAVLGSLDIRSQLDAGFRASVKQCNERIDKNRYILSRLIDCVKFCGAFELALKGHDETADLNNPGIYRGLIDFVSEIDIAMKRHPDSDSVFNGRSKTIQNEILDSILEVCHNEIRNEISQSKFVAIQADEMTDISTSHHLVLVLRYELRGNIRERFWKFMTLKDHTAVGIASEIVKELQFLNIKQAQLIGQSYDGAAVMSGQSGGVQALIKASYPYAHFIHCYAHQLNLIMERSASTNITIRNFFANLRSFPTFFLRSPKRTDILKDIVNRKIPSAPTRWNFNVKPVIVVHTYREQLKECMEHILETVNLDADTINQAGMLFQYLNDDNFNYWLNFFAKIMPHCDLLFKQLHSMSNDLLEVNKNIEDFTRSVQNIRDNTHISLTQPSKKCKPNDLSHYDICNEVCDTIVNQTNDRFAYVGHLITAKLFASKKFPDYRRTFPKNDFDIVTSTYDFIDKMKLKNELAVIYYTEDFYVTDGALSILQLFTKNNLLEVFSESVTLLRIICTIPMTSVESERRFTTLKKIKSFLRNTMSQDRLNALAILSIEKDLISSISDFNVRVIEVFSKSENRRMDFLYK